MRLPDSGPLGGAGNFGDPRKGAERIVLRRGDDAGQAGVTRLRQCVRQAIQRRVGVERAAHHLPEHRDVRGVEMKAEIRGDLAELR